MNEADKRTLQSLKRMLVAIDAAQQDVIKGRPISDGGARLALESGAMFQEVGAYQARFRERDAAEDTRPLRQG